MFRVGLTGNVGAGKSTVLEVFKGWGAWAIDADVLAREAVLPGTPALRAIAERFGRGVLQSNGALDRAALRRRVMSDPAEREALNDIVHPIVARLTAEREQEAARAGARIIVHDVPLLFEALDPDTFDALVLVDAPPATRKDRLMKTRGLSAREADDLIAAQAPPGDKRARSNFVIDNDGPREALERRAREVWSELLARAGLV
ncbi:MAG: dephospho-CoA kinase [Gemmatimonadales bacterium]